MQMINRKMTGDEALAEVMSRLGEFVRSTYFYYISESVDYYENGKIVNGRVVMYSESTYRIY